MEGLGDAWGRLCASKGLESRWADRLSHVCRMAWSPELELRGFFKGAINCLSALLAAERYEELLELRKRALDRLWP